MRLRLLGTEASGGTPGTGRSRRRKSSALAGDGISVLTDVTRDFEVQLGGIDAIDRGAAGPIERIVLTQIGRSAPPHAHLGPEVAGLCPGLRRAAARRLSPYSTAVGSGAGADVPARCGGQALAAAATVVLTSAEIAQLQDEVRALARERERSFFAHNYQVPEVQDVADFVGDSLALSRKAAESDKHLISFCGVHFMAETASVLCPEKTVLLPDLATGCSLADTITAEQLRAWKAEHPGAIVVMYVNTSAEVKAETNYCCTSSNAVGVVQHVWREHGDDTEILFGPDMWLGTYVERTTGRSLRVWMGECHVHAGITPQDIEDIRAQHPGAEFLIHPECGCTTAVMEFVASGDVAAAHCHMLSTGGMLKYARESDAQEFIVATETGMLHPLQDQNPGKRFIPVSRMAVCR